ncbi:tetratricopeptide repeat protein [Verrucomicrobia bacterium]|jgi:tetratricopeptide (TPR) repeat protein|nr:tetratricopeptide repeat protein [Verrucomicrobiota bacterium]
MQRFERKWFGPDSTTKNSEEEVVLDTMLETKANALPPQLREQYEKAKQAFDRKNLDYAVTLLENVLKLEPSCYDARQVLRATQVKRHDGKQGFFKKMLGTASSSSGLAKAQIALRTNPSEAMHLLEPIISNDPNSVLAHKTLAQAAMICEFPKTAVLSLEIAYRIQKNDKETALRLADALIAAGNPKRAEDILSDLVSEIPSDPELNQALKNATAKRSLGEGGYEKIAGGTGSYRDILRDEKEAVRLEDENRGTKGESSVDRLAAEYEAEREANPNDQKPLRKLADLYREAKDLDKALPLYQQLADSDHGTDSELHVILSDLKLAQFDQQAASIDPASDTYEAEYQEFQSQKAAFRFKNCLTLVERFPTDLKLRLELGEHYLEQGKVTEAIKELQRAQANTNVKPRAQKLLADCFCKRGMLDLAERTLQSAIKDKTVFDDEKKDLVYSLGSVLEQSGKPTEAIEQFKLIYEVDIDFKDVGDKVDQYYSSL